MESLEVVTAGIVRAVDLSGNRITIGRGADNDVILEGDARASRQHGVLTRTDGVWSIVDAGSTNGTYVNSVRISGPVEVNEDDHIIMGASVISLVGAPSTPAAPRHIDLGTAIKAGQFQLSTEDRQLLSLLANGATDREIATVLQMTPSEVTAAVAELAARTAAPRRIDLARLGAQLRVS